MIRIISALPLIEALGFRKRARVIGIGQARPKKGRSNAR